MRDVFAIMDNLDQYVDEHSIYFDKIDKKVIYRPTATYINFKILYPDILVDKIIYSLDQLVLLYNLNYTFSKKLIFQSDV